MCKLMWVNNEQYQLQKNVEQAGSFLSHFTLDQVHRVSKFHHTYEKFNITPLRSLKAFASLVGVENVIVKDESFRFDLNAFKVLGGVYAIGRYVADKLGRDIDELSFEQLKSEEVKEQLGDLIFISTTDGNHGRGVAWAARELGLLESLAFKRGFICLLEVQRNACKILKTKGLMLK
ncbi:pyridoxal-phosphate dependent enzyme [Lysinibacillus xylanilyticus]|uniref:pyridoxal-phosphate dependent enzyme n=1 Tax=Lysinibacillus xylanilyticus TaxID=582475 RepID=UPI003D03AB09